MSHPTRTFLLVTTVLLAWVTASVPAVAGSSDRTASASTSGGVAKRDANCSDFATQAAAQRYFLNHGGPRNDPDGLDADGDGIACESNPCPCDHSTHPGGTQPPPARDTYAAIALNLKGKAGTSRGLPTKAGAFRQAVRTCDRGASPKFRCVRVGAVRNGCAAVWFVLDGHGHIVSTGPRKARFATGRTAAAAVRNARQGHPGGHGVKVCS